MNRKDEKEKPFKNDYAIYNRKSTDDADNQKNSLAYQTIEAIKFAKANKLSIAKADIAGFCKAGIINESHTGFKEDGDLHIGEDGRVQYKIERPKFERLVHALLKGEFRGVIFLCWDRASRNKNDNNILRKMIKMGIDIRFVQAHYDDSSAGELHMDVDEMFAQHHSRVTSEKVKITGRKMRNEGICNYRSPIGYLNDGNPRNIPFDPIRAPLVKQLFEKYAEGTWSLSDLARWANDNGLTTKPVRRKRTLEERLETGTQVEIEPVSRPITFNHTHKILTNSFYIGQVKGNDGVFVKSTSHKALIDEDLFYKVQGLLNTKKVSVHYKERLYFAYRGLLRCNESGRAYTPYEQKGIHYYGARCPKGCTNSNHNINADFIEKKVGAVISGLFFTPEERADIDHQVRHEVATLEDKRIAQMKAISQEKNKLRDDLSYLRKNKLTLLKNGVYTGEDYLEQESHIAQRLEALRNEEEASDISMEEVIKDIVFLSELLEDAYLYYTLANPTEKLQIITKVFSELTLSGDTLNYKCRNGFKVLENRKTLLCDPTENRTPISRMKT